MRTIFRAQLFTLTCFAGCLNTRHPLSEVPILPWYLSPSLWSFAVPSTYTRLQCMTTSATTKTTLTLNILFGIPQGDLQTFFCSNQLASPLHGQNSLSVDNGQYSDSTTCPHVTNNLPFAQGHPYILGYDPDTINESPNTCKHDHLIRSTSLQGHRVRHASLRPR